MLKRFGNHSALIGYEPVNEPLNTANVLMKEFYREVRKLVQRYSPQAYFVMHDSFEFNYTKSWADIFAKGDREMIAVDHHKYMAWWPLDTVTDYCDRWEQETSMADDWIAAGYEVWWGEWALGTDVCAHWLGGFNDENTWMGQWPGKPTCTAVKCPKSYMPDDFDTEFDRKASWMRPWGSGNITQCGVNKGQCWIDSDRFNHTQVGQIAKCILDKFDDHGVKVNFLWTARNEIEEKWSYIGAWNAGWTNLTAVNETTLMKSHSYRTTYYAEQYKNKDGDMKVSFLK